MPRRFVLASGALGLCVAAVLAAMAATSSATVSATPRFGVGLQLGRVVHTAKVGASIGPWLVWNRSSCSFVRAKTHPRAYRANIRKIVGGPSTIGYLHYGDTDPFGVANTRSINKMAALAGFKINRYNLKYPSPTEPLVQARNAVTRKEPFVIEGQLVDTLNTAFIKILHKDGCIPNVHLYLPFKGVPAFGSVWTQTGTLQGQWLAREAKKRGWKPAETALVSCTDPSVGASVNVMFDTAQKALLANGFRLPRANIFRLVCKYSTTESAQVRLRDWLTAHPNFKNLLINTIDDERTQGEINALRQAGRLDDALTIASGVDELGQKQIRSGLQSGSVALFPERWGEWIIPLTQDIMAGNPVPSFVGFELVVVTRANINRYYPE